MPVTADKPGPYGPAATVIEVMNRNRERGLPTPINAENLARIGVPTSLVSRIQYTLLALDLIDDSGNPTSTLENLRLAPEAEYKKRQEDWLRSAYADIFSVVDPTKDDEVRVRDAFRNYQPVGQQSRMVTLFLGLCAAAGMTPEKSIPTTRPAARQQNRQPIASPTARVVSAKGVASAKGSTAKAHSLVRANSALPPALSGLMESLPDASHGWTRADRDKFYITFGTVLDFCIPIRTVAQMSENSGQE
jgi:hypothetical protein